MHAHLPILFHLATVVFHLASMLFHLVTHYFTFPVRFQLNSYFPHTFNLYAILLNLENFNMLPTENIMKGNNEAHSIT